MPKSVGIDLGTTNSVVAVIDETGEPVVIVYPGGVSGPAAGDGYGEVAEGFVAMLKSGVVPLTGGAVRLTFTHLGGGLTAKADVPLTGFTIAGADKKFVPADAHIVGDAVVVSSAQISAPIAVRYAWAADPAELRVRELV